MGWLAAIVLLLLVAMWPAVIWRIFRVIWVCRVPAASAIGGGILIWRVPQARDLFADTGLSLINWLWFFLLLLVWAWLVHAMARRALQFDEWVPEAQGPNGLSDADRTRLQKLYLPYAIWIPRLLGLSVIAFVMLALSDTRANFNDATALEQVAFAISRLKSLIMIGGAVALIYFAVVTLRREVRARFTGQAKEKPLLIAARSMLLLLLRPVHNWPVLRQIFSSRVNQILLVIAILISAAFVVALANPTFLSDMLPRAIFLPVLLGGGLLLFGEIASLSHRFRTPLLLGFFVLGAVLGYLLNRYNDVHWIEASKPPGGAHQLALDAAIKRWKADNCPEAAADNTTGPCNVRPIIVAGAGGASRAGFYTATVVGALMDASPSGKPGDVRNRIFALSTVSGSSVGAVMMRAAWMDAIAASTPDSPPCKGKGVTAWFRATADVVAENKGATTKVSWRDCFQQLMSGDFLSPVFVGLAYRDIFPLGNFLDGKAFWTDRSGLLEQSFERWYSEVAGDGAAICEDQERASKERHGLCRAVGHLPDRPDLTRKGDWLPLLFINGTSVATGRRIIVSDVRVDCLLGPKHAFLETAYDATELRNPTYRRSGSANCIDGLDDPPHGSIEMKLSAAALMSARFPIISTQGVIRDDAGKMIDSVVDGGYFENDGLATAADIVRELRDARLQPIVLLVINEPETVIPPSPEHGDARPLIPFAQERTLFDVYTSIGRALYATRSGHEDGHLEYLRSTLNGDPVTVGINPLKSTAIPAQPSLCRSPVKTRTEMPVVSMSWWISQPVQAYLDAQLCAPEIDRVLTCEMKREVGRDGKLTGAACPQ